MKIRHLFPLWVLTHEAHCIFKKTVKDLVTHRQTRKWAGVEHHRN